MNINILFIISIISTKDIFVQKKVTKSLYDNQISLYYGLDNVWHKRSQRVKFKVDFHFSYILLQNDFICNQQNSCTLESDKVYGPNRYQDMSYNYKHIRTFLGLTQQITRTFNQQDVHTYFNVPFRILEPGCQIQQNVLGLSMKSTILEHWVDLYNFKNDIIHFDIVLEKGDQRLIFWNMVLPFKNDWIISRKGYAFTQWRMKLQIKKYDHVINDSNAVFSFEYERDLLFTLTRPQYVLLQSYLCIKGTPCNEQKDLQPDVDKYHFIMYAQNDYKIIYQLTELFQIGEDQKLKLLFEINHPRFQQVDIVFQKLFFQRYFLTIQNDLNDTENYLIKVQDLSILHNVFKNSFVIFTIWFFVLVLIFCLSYTIYSKYFVKRKAYQEYKSNFKNQLNL